MARVWLAGGAVLLGVLLVASIVVAMTSGEEALSEGTPEGAVQQYLKAVEADDYPAAYGWLSERLKQDCTLEQFAGGDFPGNDRLKDTRVSLVETRKVGDTTFVTVRITQFYGGGGPFDASESSYEQLFTLKQEDGQWRLSEYPWPFYGCRRFEPVPPKPEPTATPTPTPTPSPTPSPSASASQEQGSPTPTATVTPTQ